MDNSSSSQMTSSSAQCTSHEPTQGITWTSLHKFDIGQCSGCKNAQEKNDKNIPNVAMRTQRSNSCPAGTEGFMPLPTRKTVANHSKTVKRWHSLKSLEFSNNIHVPQQIDTPQNTATSWLPLITEKYNVRKISLSRRVLSLFGLGATLALLLNFLQRQKRVTVFSPGLFGDVLNSAWWIPPTFGIAAIAIGLLYPKLDQILGNQGKLKQEWSSVMRCIAVFVGMNHACAKISFDSNVQLSITLAMLSLGLWYFFDQSLMGLIIGLATTSIATVITQLLAANEVFGYANPDFLYMQSWVPCLFFSGGVTVGAVGRALASLEDGTVKQHQD